MRHAEEFVYQAIDLGLFEIDEEGRIWRIRRQQTSRWGQETRIVDCARKRAETNWNGRYLFVRFMLQGEQGVALAHRLIWRFFNGPIPDDLTINHKDGRRHNNHLINLELATHSEQSLHAVHVLGWRPTKMFRAGHAGSSGENNGMAKLDSAAVVEIRTSLKTGIALAREYGVSTATISRVRNERLWRGVLCEQL